VAALVSARNPGKSYSSARSSVYLRRRASHYCSALFSHSVWAKRRSAG